MMVINCQQRRPLESLHRRTNDGKKLEQILCSVFSRLERQRRTCCEHETCTHDDGSYVWFWWSWIQNHWPDQFPLDWWPSSPEFAWRAGWKWWDFRRLWRLDNDEGGDEKMKRQEKEGKDEEESFFHSNQEVCGLLWTKKNWTLCLQQTFWKLNESWSSPFYIRCLPSDTTTTDKITI